MNTPDIKSVFVEVALVYCCCWLNFISKKKRHKCEHYSQASFCDTDNQRVNDGSKMKNSSSALQQATRPAGHKTQDQATQTTCEIPSPVKSNRDSADFIKNEVLRIPFFFPPFSPFPRGCYSHHKCSITWEWARGLLLFRNLFGLESINCR